MIQKEFELNLLVLEVSKMGLLQIQRLPVIFHNQILNVVLFKDGIVCHVILILVGGSNHFFGDCKDENSFGKRNRVKLAIVEKDLVADGLCFHDFCHSGIIQYLVFARRRKKLSIQTGIDSSLLQAQLY